MQLSNVSYVVQTVKDSVSAMEAGVALGLAPDRDGRCACPVHSGARRNCKLYSDERGYYCFVCHSGGDVIDLVRRTNGGTFTDAVQWLSDAFHLGIDTSTTVDEKTRQRANKRAETRKKLNVLHRIAERKAFDAYLKAGAFVVHLERIIADQAPKTPDEPFSAAYAAACRILPEAREIADETAMLVMRG